MIEMGQGYYLVCSLIVGPLDLIHINFNNKYAYLVGGFRLSPFVGVIANCIFKWWLDQLHCLIVVVKLDWWLVNHSCCVHSDCHFCLALWNVCGGCKHLELGLN